MKDVPRNVSFPVSEKTDDARVSLERTPIDMENQVEDIAHSTTTKSTKLSFNKTKIIFVFVAILTLLALCFVGFFKFYKEKDETVKLEDDFIFYLQEYEEGRLGKDDLLQKCSILAEKMSFEDAIKYDSYEYTIAHILLIEPLKRDDLFKTSISSILSFEAFIDCGYVADDTLLTLIQLSTSPPDLLTLQTSPSYLFTLANDSLYRGKRTKFFTKILVQGPPQSDEDRMLRPLIIQKNQTYPYKDKILKVLKFKVSLLYKEDLLFDRFSENNFYLTAAILAIFDKNELNFKNVIKYIIDKGLDKSFLAIQRHEVACGGTFNNFETSFLNDTDLFTLAEKHSTETYGNIRIFEVFKNAQIQ